MSTRTSSPSLPSAIALKLRSIRRRGALLAVLSALLLSGAVLLVAMVVSMGLDWAVTLFDIRARGALTALSLLSSACVLTAILVSGWRESRRWLHAAESADSRTPQLEERWRTVASFAVSGRRPASATARAMLEQVTSESIALERLVDPCRAAPLRSLRPALAAAAGGMLLATLFLASRWDRTSVLLRRFWSPTAEITATQIRRVTGDIRTPRGEMIELEADLSGVVPASAQVMIRYGDGGEEGIEITPEDGVCAHALRAENSFHYRILAGDARSPWHDVRVLRHPELAAVRLRVIAPDYVDRPVVEKSLLPNRLKVVQGSRLVLEMQPAGPLQESALILTEADAEKSAAQRVVLRPDDAGWLRHEMPLAADVALRIALTSIDGLTNEDGQVCRIDVVEDRAPVARIISPVNEMAVATDDVIDIKFEAHDDHGVALAELVVYGDPLVEGQEPQELLVETIPLGDQFLRKHVVGEVQLDLKALGLPEGTSISYAIRVTDNREMPAEALAAAAAANREPTDNSMALAMAPPAGEGVEVQESSDGGTRSESAASETEGRPQDGAPSAADSDGSEPDRLREGSTAAPATGEARMPEQPDPAAASAGQSSDSESEAAPALDAADAPPVGGREEATSDSTADQEDRGASPPSGRPEAPPGDERRSGATASAGAETSSRPIDETSAADAEARANPAAPRAEDQTDEPTSPTAPESTAPPANPQDPALADDSRPAAEKTATVDAPARPAGAMEGFREQRFTAGSRSSQQAGEPQTPQAIARRGQQSESGQNAETSRRRLKIAARLSAVAEAVAMEEFNATIRGRIVAIERMLGEAEQGLRRLEERQIADADRADQYGIVDQQLGRVEEFIARLREETAETEFTFVGLQMVDIARSHVTPARDRVFLGLREPLTSGGDSAASLHHVIRARELLAALLKQYDDVMRERRLQRGLDEAITIYEVYVEKTQQLLREARQNRNPLERKMAILELDQAYLDRLAEVITLRREMLQELSHMLANDPRLMSRYFDLIRRRRSSLRDQLGELAERQDEIAAELTGWLAVDDDQRPDVWMLVTETRLHAATDLAQDAARVNERMRQQLPLLLEQNRGGAERMLTLSELAARESRQIALDAEAVMSAAGNAEQGAPLADHARSLVATLEELQAALDQLQFDHDRDEEVNAYVRTRQQEVRAVQNAADDWLQAAGGIRQQSYATLARIDQHQHAIATELLRGEMQDLNDDIQLEFQRLQADSIPVEIPALVNELQGVMEAIVFRQRAAVFALLRDRLEQGREHCTAAVDLFDRAEELFDSLRRKMIEALDEYDVPNPDIADLQDPTLDEFIARLEREPNLQAQLGLPRRRRNIRVTADFATESGDAGTTLLANSADAAMRRTQAVLRRPPPQGGADPDKPEEERTEEDRQERERQREIEEKLEQALAAIREKQQAAGASEAERRELEALRTKLERLRQQMSSRRPEAQEWSRRAEADAAAAVLAALAQGDKLPDDQWNKILSSLDDGLWQVQGRTPPEAYRKAIEQYQDRLRKLTGAEESP